MRIQTLLFSGVALFWMSACGSKQYYSPKQSVSLSPMSGAEVVSISREAAMLSDGTPLSKEGQLQQKLNQGYALINRTGSNMLLADKEGNVKVITPTKNLDLTLPRALIGGRVIGNKLVYLLQDNSFGVYDLEAKKIVYNNKSEKALSIDTRVANPYQVDNLVVIPTLNGKLTVLELSSLKVVKEIYVSTESILNNIIFLGRLGDTLIAATPYRVISVSAQGQRSFDKEISEVTVDQNRLFVFAKDGMISELDPSMRVLNEKKFKFAHFSSATMKNGKIYALDKQGYLIVLNPELTQEKVYKLPEIEGYSFISGDKLYYDGNVINLAKLSYR